MALFGTSARRHEAGWARLATNRHPGFAHEMASSLWFRVMAKGLVFRVSALVVFGWLLWFLNYTIGL